jgi:hypothetical protein
MRILAIGPWEFEVLWWTGDDKIFWFNSGPHFVEICLFRVVLFWGREE